MSYHLNIHRTGDHNYSFDLDELLATIKDHDPEVYLVKWRKSIKEISVADSSIGKLYYCNGQLWSIYQSEIQLKKLVEYFAEFNFEVVGEEGEVYDKYNLEEINQEKKLLRNEGDFPTKVIGFFKHNLLSLVIISAIVLIGLIL